MSKVNDLFDEKVEKIIDSIETNGKSWIKMWNGGGFPKNAISRKGYKGFNFFMLLHVMLEGGYKSNHFVTYKQARELGGNIIKGEKGHTIFYFNVLDKKDAEGNIELDEKGMKKKIFFMKYYTVFNLDQTEGIDTKEFETEGYINQDERDLEIEKFISSLNINIEFKGHQACFIPSEDLIVMPDFKEFKDRDNYYATLFHEITHLSGSTDRLNRKKSDYAYEELVAELGAVYLGIYFGVKIEECQHEEYLKSWVQNIREKKSTLWKAASEAQRAFDYICEMAEIAEDKNEDSVKEVA